MVGESIEFPHAHNHQNSAANPAAQFKLITVNSQCRSDCWLVDQSHKAKHKYETNN